MKRMILAAATLAAMMSSACASNSTKADNYTVTMSGDSALNGARAYITNYDTGEPVDSIVIADGQIVFNGSVDTPIIARMVIGGNRGPIFMLEPGQIAIDAQGDATGTPLNDALVNYGKEQQKIVAEFNGLPQDSSSLARGQELQAKYEANAQATIDANADNALGLLMLLQGIYDIQSVDELNARVAKYPVLANSSRVAKYRESLANVDATSVGKKFRDFTIDYNGTTQSLSDYVGKGKYTLVDFWASWCGPCIRETKVLKELYKKYSDKGLDFLGVAVWDEPANSEGAIKRLELPWPNIINAQSVPTDLYGISGIPCIILFGPDGTIVSRGKQGADLVAEVEAVMEQK